ncbi:hypothetical protein BU16DRAFT_66467 [Lophium mytilinum]|uniref:Uncharacterized protein n=1 Tax=Lophium mytilinum TaxID=390894 RepID=A0A6A6QPU2_9PEZI|nr:hypothetical protein BU16DRAFT_66467 [Lophium mytilinum]
MHPQSPHRIGLHTGKKARLHHLTPRTRPCVLLVKMGRKLILRGWRYRHMRCAPRVPTLELKRRAVLLSAGLHVRIRSVADVVVACGRHAIPCRTVLICEEEMLVVVHAQRRECNPALGFIAEVLLELRVGADVVCARVVGPECDPRSVDAESDLGGLDGRVGGLLGRD